MARELLILVDTTTGDLLVEGPDRLSRDIGDALESLLGPSRTIACAAPADVRLPEPASADVLTSSDCVRIAGFWHGSLIEGPGRRTVVKLQGCPVRCVGFISSLASSVASCSATLSYRAEEGACDRGNGARAE